MFSLQSWSWSRSSWILRNWQEVTGLHCIPSSDFSFIYSSFVMWYTSVSFHIPKIRINRFFVSTPNQIFKAYKNIVHNHIGWTWKIIHADKTKLGLSAGLPTQHFLVCALTDFVIHSLLCTKYFSCLHLFILPSRIECNFGMRHLPLRLRFQAFILWDIGSEHALLGLPQQHKGNDC